MGWLAWLLLVPLFFYAMKMRDREAAERARREQEQQERLRLIEARIDELERAAALSPVPAPYIARSTIDD